jgi:hypothetical protein
VHHGGEVQFEVLYTSTVIGRKDKRIDRHTPLILTDLAKYLPPLPQNCNRSTSPNVVFSSSVEFRTMDKVGLL